MPSEVVMMADGRCRILAMLSDLGFSEKSDVWRLVEYHIAVCVEGSAVDCR